jgi:predicted nucleic acid-binding protein
VTVHHAAVIDTNIIAALRLYDPSEFPEMLLITAVTLGELSFGPHATDDPAKRAGRVAVLQHVEATFDPLPYDQGAARLFGQICAAVRTAGREPRKRVSDLMIAATAASNQLPLYTANPDDFRGSEGLVEVIEVKARPNNLWERAKGIEPS